MKFIAVTITVLMLALSACETTVINRGYVIESADFKKIQPGVSDAKFVYQNFGSPTIRSTLRDDSGCYSWYYVYKRTEKTSFWDPKVVDQKTMIVTFDANGLVKNVKESTYERPLSTISEKTKTEGKTGGVGEAFSGLGKYLKPYTQKK